VTAPALTCREVIALLTDYVEDALAAEERLRVEAHIATCDGCTTYLEQVRETIRLTGMLTEEQIPDEEKQRLLAAFRHWTRPGSSGG
jgi:anti-sigma factor RsiW